MIRRPKGFFSKAARAARSAAFRLRRDELRQKRLLMPARRKYIRSGKYTFDRRKGFGIASLFR